MATTRCACGKNLILDMEKMLGKCHACQRWGVQGRLRDSHRGLPAIKKKAVGRLESVGKYLLTIAEQRDDRKFLEAANNVRKAIEVLTEED